MKSHILYNEFHLGDCLVALHLLRALAKQDTQAEFVFFTHECNLPQLAAVTSDISNIFQAAIEHTNLAELKRKGINTWKNFDGAWERSPHRWQWAKYTLWYHAFLSVLMGYSWPFSRREHLLFDYPALDSQPMDDDGDWPFDFLIGDSAPNSGQYSEWADHSKRPLDSLIEALRSRKWRVRLTSELKAEGFTISEIGRLSVHCKHHIMVPNGPFWPTMNVHNNHHSHGRRRIVVLDNGEDLGMPHIDQVPNVAVLTEIAKQEGWVD